MKVTKEMGFIPADTTITLGDPVFIDVGRAPFCVYGACSDYRRVPADVGAATSEAVARLGSYSAGIRLKFKTDSDYIVLHAVLGKEEMNIYNTAYLGSYGFDLFKKNSEGKYEVAGAFIPSQGQGKDYIESRVRVGEGMKEFLIHFPLYAGVEKCSIALREGSTLEAPDNYKYETPVVFYGSSIVNGSCASVPGSAYPSIISRMIDTDFINLGFGGAALAENAIIDYIKGLPMSVFVYDYDHNAPNPEYLEKTHYAAYLRFREARPDVPVIMASKPDYYSDPETNEIRRQIIISSYNKALASGDKLVSFVDGKTMYPEECRNFATADGCHPNDMGYFLMAKAIGAKVKEYLENS
ncbi:MAG: hypothetical protein KBS59_03410 [Clostridiales bacterium]|nr:hypothetical protein [Clostridiales bacterium]